MVIIATNATPTFTPATNFQGTNGQAVGVTYDTTYPAFGLSVYKNYDSYHQRDMYLNEHITNAVEMCCGAHYYSRGKRTTLYSIQFFTAFYKELATFILKRDKHKNKALKRILFQGFVELLSRVERPTSSLPRMRSTY